MKDKGERYLKLFGMAMGMVLFVYLVLNIGYYLNHKNDMKVVYQAGEISEGFNEMEMTSNETTIEDVEIKFIDESEFEDVDNEEIFEGNPNIPLSIELQKLIKEKCEEHSVNEAIILMIIESESTFRSSVGNEKILGGTEGGSRYYGYMQLSAANCNRAKSEFDLDAHTPEGNIEYGIILISELIEKYGELDKVITAYKCGESVADAGKRYKKCDELTDRVMYWQDVIAE